jgi:predicted HicB family RNase H-like nuclease
MFLVRKKYVEKVDLANELDLLYNQIKHLSNNVLMVEEELKKFKGYYYRTKGVEQPKSDTLTKEQRDFLESTIEYQEMQKSDNIKNSNDSN